MENGVRKREWVKTAAIILLAVLLVLTFFSKTIMNASLPEVATQQVSSGAINARIRGQGTVEASEVYNVTIKQTRKVSSVLVKTGQEINVGDTLFVLEAEDSDEVSKAEDALQEAQDAYDKALIDAGIEAAKNDRTIQKAQEAYNEALALYNQYSTVSATQLESELIKCSQKKRDLNAQKATLTQQKTDVEKLKTEASTGLSELESDVAALRSIKAAVDTLKRDQFIYQSDYDALYTFAGSLKSLNVNLVKEVDAGYADLLEDKCHGQDVNQIAAALAKDETLFNSLVAKAVEYPSLGNPNPQFELSRFYGGTEDRFRYKELALAYTTLTKDQEAIDALNVFDINYAITKNGEIDNNALNSIYETKASELKTKKALVDQYTDEISNYESSITSIENEIASVEDSEGRLNDAKSYADKVESTKDELSDLLFTKSLGDSSSIGMEAQKRAIEKQKADLEKLRENADEVEVKASVSGTIASISASAGKSIGGEEQPLATINVTDRGFTVKIDVTNEQAKKVKVGDTAELVNFWGGDAVATLDQITNSQSSGNRTLVFTLTGDIQAGQNITLSIGQKSANYDALIPLSGLREDSNGKFVYVLQSKNSPLGSRYIATRVTVQELARDDKSAAVSGISQGDFIITTSNKPVEAGKQVRLADNG